MIDPDRRRVTVRGEEVDLTHLEFELLVTMAYAPGRVFTRDMLLERAWGGSAYRERRTVDVHVLHLREKIERDPRDPEYVITVRGLGYRFRDSGRVGAAAVRWSLRIRWTASFVVVTLVAVGAIALQVLPTLESTMVQERLQALTTQTRLAIDDAAAPDSVADRGRRDRAP